MATPQPQSTGIKRKLENLGQDVSSIANDSGEEEQSKRIEVSSNLAGRIIGKGGIKLNKLKKLTGTKILVTEDSNGKHVFEVKGKPASISQVETNITEAVAQWQPAVPEDFQVPEDKVYDIVGRDGSVMQYLQSASGTKIKWQLEPAGSTSAQTGGRSAKKGRFTHRDLSISGTANQIQRAKLLMNEIMDMRLEKNPVLHYKAEGPPPQGHQPGAPERHKRGYGRQLPKTASGAPEANLQGIDTGHMLQPVLYPSKAHQQLPNLKYPPQQTSSGFSSGYVAYEAEGPRPHGYQPGAPTRHHGYQLHETASGNQQQGQQLQKPHIGPSITTDTTSYGQHHREPYTYLQTQPTYTYPGTPAGQQIYQPPTRACPTNTYPQPAGQQSHTGQQSYQPLTPNEDPQLGAWRGYGVPQATYGEPTYRAARPVWASTSAGIRSTTSEQLGMGCGYWKPPPYSKPPP